MDGRVQIPVIAFLKKHFDCDYVDNITEPGPDKILSQRKKRASIASIKKRVRISIEKHNSKVIAIAGHYDCAGNPVRAEEHFRQIKKSVNQIQGWGYGIPIISIWVNKKFKVKRIV